MSVVESNLPSLHNLHFIFLMLNIDSHAQYRLNRGWKCLLQKHDVSKFSVSLDNVRLARRYAEAAN
jgi:hypothetical protein